MRPLVVKWRSLYLGRTLSRICSTGCIFQGLEIVFKFCLAEPIGFNRPFHTALLMHFRTTADDVNYLFFTFIETALSSTVTVRDYCKKYFRDKFNHIMWSNRRVFIAFDSFAFSFDIFFLPGVYCLWYNHEMCPKLW